MHADIEGRLQTKLLVMVSKAALWNWVIKGTVICVHSNEPVRRVNSHHPKSASEMQRFPS